MSYLIVGASAGLGRFLSERFAASGANLILVATDARDLAALKSDLEVSHKVEVRQVQADLGSSRGWLEAISEAVDEAGPLDGILCPIGAVSPDDGPALDAENMERLTRVNYLSILSVIGRLLPLLRDRQGGVIVGFGSIAASRGRGVNTVYAAAKRALESYFESLRHETADSNVTVQFYVPGYLDTNLAYGKKTLFPHADAEKLSQIVFSNLHRDVGVVYYPGYWRYVVAVLRVLPWALFRRLNF